MAASEEFYLRPVNNKVQTSPYQFSIYGCMIGIYVGKNYITQGPIINNLNNIQGTLTIAELSLFTGSFINSNGISYELVKTWLHTAQAT